MFYSGVVVLSLYIFLNIFKHLHHTLTFTYFHILSLDLAIPAFRWPRLADTNKGVAPDRVQEFMLAPASIST